MDDHSFVDWDMEQYDAGIPLEKIGTDRFAIMYRDGVAIGYAPVAWMRFTPYSESEGLKDRIENPEVDW